MKLKRVTQNLVKARLVIFDGAREGTSVPLILKETLVGRIDSAHLVLDEPSVSRLHARLTLTPEGAILEDLDSLEGTWLNGVAIKEPGRVRRGDVIAFAESSFRFEF